MFFVIFWPLSNESQSRHSTNYENEWWTWSAKPQLTAQLNVVIWKLCVKALETEVHGFEFVWMGIEDFVTSPRNVRALADVLLPCPTCNIRNCRACITTPRQRVLISRLINHLREIRRILCADERVESLNRRKSNCTTAAAVKAWNGTHLNGAVEEAVVLAGSVEEALGVCQLMLVRRCEEVHGEVAHHRRFVGGHVRLEVRADRHFMDFCLNYHVVIAVGRYWILRVTLVAICQRKNENVG